MATVMTKEWLVKHCKERGLYRTPYLNDRLYLQSQALCDIHNLEDYTGVKLLYLEENCLESMNGIQTLKQLQCLYLRRNFIKSIDYLDELQFLDTMDISQNYIRCLENLSKCLNLRVLVVSHNQLESIESIDHLKSCPSIMILDLSHNILKDGDGVLEIAMALPQLTVLYLSGNPCISRMRHYRKQVIGNLAKLTHLDDRPVFWDERLYAAAWLKGGPEAETAERDRVREIRAEEETRQFESMRRIREESMEERLHVVRPNPLQFEPSVVGEDQPKMCLGYDESREPSQDETDTKQVCSENAISNAAPGEVDVNAGRSEAFQVDLLSDTLKVIPLSTAPSQLIDNLTTSSVADTVKLLQSHDTEVKLENNPLFIGRASESQGEELWPGPNSSMFPSEVHSISLPKWVGSATRIDTFPDTRDNKIFWETTVDYPDSKSQHTGCTSDQCIQQNHRPQYANLGFSNQQGHGSDALASLAAPEMKADLHRRPTNTIKETDNFILSLQEMNSV